MVVDDDDWETAVVDDAWGLDWYRGGNVPGQPWKCYRSGRYEETEGEKDLRARLIELLTPSTLQEDLDRIPRRDGKIYCPYLRFSQKAMHLEEWLVPQAHGDPLVHNGAHFPICVFTNNSRARSKEKQEERAARFRDRNLQRAHKEKATQQAAQQAWASEDDRSRGDTNNRSREQQTHHGAYVAQCTQVWAHDPPPNSHGSWQGWQGQGWRNDDWRSTQQTQQW